ncbi:hypothetical protein GCM10010465_24020 [Actinomadura fibrosa]
MELLKENEVWKKQLSYTTEEINFLHQLLTADIYQKNILNMYEKLQLFSNDLENFRSENIEFTMEVHNHRYDIEGMLECEDISCEIFYHDEHLKLENRIQEFLERFRNYKLEVFSSTGHAFRKTSTEH